jgi:hypothetical protein
MAGKKFAFAPAIDPVKAKMDFGSNTYTSIWAFYRNAGQEELRDRPLALLQAALIVLARPRPRANGYAPTVRCARPRRARSRRAHRAPETKRDQDQVVEIPGFQAWETGDNGAISGDFWHGGPVESV